MQFKKLKLVGFKSFVEPSEFLIEPGLTGIVGPNGCGKSNLVEALRWVMGESSHKAMRAAEMDDVIFSGTNNRPARNNAEIMLVLDNSDRSAPAAFNDEETIEVSRRIEREAGSAYRINGREVRQRDVHILFADASSGSRSPALVRQGQIGEIVNAKPEQRRRILEEAAGISGLHARRHEAEVRLKAAEHNLQRLEDVIVQIASQIDGLKRQARQATRYKNVANDIRKQQSLLLALRWRDAEIAVAEAERALHLTQRAVAERTKVETEALKAQTEASEKLNPLREAEAAAAAGLQRLNLARADLDREEARAKARSEELDRRLTQLAQDLERERSLAKDAGGVLARLAREEEAVVIETREREGGEEAARARLSEAEDRLAQSEKLFADATAALADFTARRHQVERALADQKERLAKLESEIAALDGQAKGGAKTPEKLSDVYARAMSAEAARSAAVQALDAARKPLTEAERQLHRLETEAKTLAKMLGMAEKKLWPPVIDTIKVDAGFETALGAALGDDLDAPTDTASPMHWGGAAAAGDPALPEGAEPLSARVKAPAALARRLAQIGIVNRADGPRLRGQLKPGQRLVSKEGDLWRWDGFIAHAEAPASAGKRLAARNRLAELDREITAARARVEELAATVKAAEREAETAEKAQDQARAALHGAAQASATAEHRARLAAGRDEIAAAQAEAKKNQSALPDGKRLSAELEAVRGVLAEDRSTMAAAKAELDGLERERAARAQRLTFLGAERAAWREREEGAHGRIQSLEERITETRNERAGLDQAPKAFAEQRKNLLTQISEAETKRRGAADRLAEAESQLTDADRAGRSALDELATAREEAARAEARLEGARERRQSLSRDVAEALGGIPDEGKLKKILEEDGEAPDPAAVEAKLSRLEQERERLGAVNLRADEELREVEAQHDGLVSERDDLVEAIKRLRQGISNLDREARARLTASFATVNEHFKKLFTGLFSGGTAELILTDSEDPLQAGLDILARPPGKKPQTLSLLSGGEQALTALSLIFAVFLTNPAPICVLDEVDAPLDDANVERFCNLLDEMIRLTSTRFLVVTHNPITMSRMNRLFGVTMAEHGVSQLVSVDLATAQSYQAA
ncbi:MAG TPA: chromosome segregation protein SMC [Xanthobacteraceae bacterium]|nr:chromosome segregation protein SMC [Xanthobacteraceae bacterium]